MKKSGYLGCVLTWCKQEFDFPPDAAESTDDERSGKRRFVAYRVSNRPPGIDRPARNGECNP